MKIDIRNHSAMVGIEEVAKDLQENKINEVVLKNSKTKKYLDNNKIIKTIFVKNKILNYIISN